MSSRLGPAHKSKAHSFAACLMSVSVIIPAYNAGSFIEDAIASVLSQETAIAEIIVVNDGSTDRDYRALERLHGAIRVIDQPNRGVSAARNRGCEIATGEYVAILDADDIWLPGKLRRQMQHLRAHTDIDAVFCRGLLWLPSHADAQWRLPEISRDSLESAPASSHLYYADFLCSIPAAPSTMVVKRSVWRDLGGFNEQLRYGEDHDFYLRLSHGHRVDLLHIVGMLYRRHSSSATATVQSKNHLADVITTAIRTLGTTDKFGRAADKSSLSRRLAHLHLEQGYAHFLSRDFQVARSEFARAARTWPLNLKAMTYLAVAATPCLRGMVRRLRNPTHTHEDGQVI